MQRETDFEVEVRVAIVISIHSLYAEGDKRPTHKRAQRFYFNPLPLCRGRQADERRLKLEIMISIHSLYAEGD